MGVCATSCSSRTLMAVLVAVDQMSDSALPMRVSILRETGRELLTLRLELSSLTVNLMTAPARGCPCWRLMTA